MPGNHLQAFFFFLVVEYDYDYYPGIITKGGGYEDWSELSIKKALTSISGHDQEKTSVGMMSTR